ncbi:Transcriptional regulatory protein TOD6 [Spathaspora sp. JA1]|nr:Transcriptional regulatory protein TOD6 [Spathaspora sp. JA1]
MDQPEDTDISSKPPAAAAAASTSGSPPPPKNYSRTPTSWDAEDDILLMHLKDNQKLGWKEIASHFTNRTPNACQFRWRRLKSGNLKNPPKSAAALGTQINTKAMIAAAATAAANKKKKQESTAAAAAATASAPKLKHEPSAFTSAYSPLPQPTFQGFDNNISNALAGLNALSNSPSYISSPMANSNPSTPRGLSITSPSIKSVIPQQQQQHSPNSDTSSSTPLDNTGSGYYQQDTGVDPGMNIPQGTTPSSLTPRNSISQGSNLVQPHPPTRTSISSITSLSRPGSISGIPPIQVPANSAPLSTMPLRNNSIIQTIRDDRTSISSLARVSVSSLPSKSMNIPHHQTTNNALAHMPVLFGSVSGSISGQLSRNASISGPTGGSGGSGSVAVGTSVSGGAGGGGIQQTNVSSLRNSSIVSTGPGYYSRSGSVVIPYNADKEEPLKIDSTKLDADVNKFHKKKIKPINRNFNTTKKTTNGGGGGTNNKNKKPGTPNPPKLEIPWSMEEDELLINRRNRELSFAELSILLPQRTEGEIWSRIDHLEKLRNGAHRPASSNDPRRNGIDFYDDDEDVIGGIGESDEEEDDDDDEDSNDSLLITRKRKRRASSAVNPLSVRDTIRKRL